MSQNIATPIGLRTVEGRGAPIVFETRTHLGDGVQRNAVFCALVELVVGTTIVENVDDRQAGAQVLGKLDVWLHFPALGKCVVDNNIGVVA